MDKKISKEIVLVDSLEDLKKTSSAKILLVVDVRNDKLSDLRNLNKYFQVLGISLDGLISFV